MWTTVGRSAARLVLPLITLGLVAAPSAAWAAPKPAPTPTPSSSASAAAGDPTAAVTFGIAPASADRADTRSFLQVGAAPGSVVYDHVAVMNQSDVPLELDVYAVSTGNTPDGSLGFAARDTAGDSTWVALGASHVTVPAQSRSAGIGLVIVPLTITVPKNAEPGDHVIGVVASLTTTGRTDSSSPGVQLEQRAGTRVYVDVQGAVTPSLSLTNLHVTYERGPAWGLLGPGTVHATWTAVNDGNVRYAVDERVGLKGPFGAGAAQQAATHVVEVVPDGRVSSAVEVHGWPVLRTAVTVTATPSTAPGGRAVSVAPVSLTVTVWTVPWAGLAALGVVVALVLLVVAARRRRRVGGRRARHRARVETADDESLHGAVASPVPTGALPEPTPAVLRSSGR